MRYQPGERLEPVALLGANALVVADARTAAAEIWLRLIGWSQTPAWIRLADSGLSPAEIAGLPIIQIELPAVRLPAWRAPGRALFGPLDGPIWFSDQLIRYQPLGRSKDNRWLAIVVAGFKPPVVWVQAEIAQLNFPLTRLILYEGDAWGRWNEPRPVDPVTASLKWFSVRIGAWPGHESEFRLLRQQPPAQQATAFPLAGRSVDGQWLALRIDQLAQPLVWVRADTVQVDVELDSIPILIATATDLLSAHTLAAPSVAGAELRDLYWRSTDALIGWNEHGIWEWRPFAGDTQTEWRQVAEYQWRPQFSPDGKWAAAGVPTQDGKLQGLRDVVLTPIGGGPQLRFEGVNQWYFTHGPGDHSLSWSPDARFVLSHRQGSVEGVTPGRFLLGVDGSQREVTEDNLPAWNRPAYQQRRQPDPSAAVADLPPLIQDGWSQQWSPGGRYGLFWRTAEAGRGAVALYDDQTNHAELIGQVSVPAHYRQPTVLWSPAGERAAIHDDSGYLYIVETDQAQMHEILGPGSGRLVAWSPAGEQLVLTAQREIEWQQVDANGFAVFRDRYYGNEAWGYYIEVQVIDRSGHQLAEYRAYTEGCWREIRADWSPDGQWIAWSNAVLDCGN